MREINYGESDIFLKYTSDIQYNGVVTAGGWNTSAEK
jgi:hypothetical protein